MSGSNFFGRDTYGLPKGMVIMTIGLPRALLYYKYRYLWETFFKELDCQIVVSGESNAETLKDSINFSIDECCLPAKIYMGHVHSLINRCDYILVPRVDNFGKKEMTCVKFNAMYDIVRNTFKGISLIDYNVDVMGGSGEFKGFIKMGKILGKSHTRSALAYRKAKEAEARSEKQRADAQTKLLDEEGMKILIVTHPYNIYDKLLGQPIIENIKRLDGVPIYADACDKRESAKKSREISKNLYWTYNKELVGSIAMYRDKIDGIILLTAFPCGPDSLVNELLLRRLRGIPTVNIILDELQGEAGLQTRIESFMDIINERRKVRNING